MNRRLNAQGTNVPTETKRAEPEAGAAKQLLIAPGPCHLLQAGPSPSLVVSKQPQMTLEKAQLTAFMWFRPVSQALLADV